MESSPPAKKNVNQPPKGALMLGGNHTKELLFGLGCGLTYGMTSAIVGQPLDSVKTKMQTQGNYRQGGMLRTFVAVVRCEGLVGLYRGILPPLFGSSIFRSVQFGAYNWSWAWLGQHAPSTAHPVPFTGGIEYRVFAAGLVSSTARSIIEAPLELIKVRQMTNQPWNIRSLYSGFGVTFLRTWGLMGTFFVLVDSAVRHFPELINTPGVGSFIKGGVCSTLAWTLVWPFELMKNQIQANTPGPSSIPARLVHIAKQHGVRGLYRGFLPGALRALIANAASMSVFDYCQQARQRYHDAHPD
eukprot:TRINITY_DN1381_c0_g1_i3.p1 TRINITY_DN1381_c0_g1~~TRINITY_DN1381_c0_g1_i3.p1  ORF type:complete len:300 (+),score=67.79 TRINITY_DN1381_c0_g1_i3:55-954(+)